MQLFGCIYFRVTVSVLKIFRRRASVAAVAMLCQEEAIPLTLPSTPHPFFLRFPFLPLLRPFPSHSLCLHLPFLLPSLPSHFTSSSLPSP